MQPLNEKELTSIRGGDWDWPSLAAWLLEAAQQLTTHGGAGSI